MTLEQYREGVISAVQGLVLSDVDRIVSMLYEAWVIGGIVFTCGNGGSSSTASHLAGDLSKGCKIPGLNYVNTFCLSDNVPALTAIANDISYDEIFSYQLQDRLHAGDVVLAISGSGNSHNVIKVIEYAKSEGITTVGLTGFNGGQLAKIADTTVIVPCHNMEQIEDVHMMICHMVKTRLLEMMDA